MRAPKPQLTTSDVIDTARALADSGGMPAYAVANLHSVTFGPAITSYLRRIDDTLAPFDGRFLVHGAKADVMEGQLVGDLVIVEFPDLERPAPGTAPMPTRRSLRCAPKTQTGPSY